MARMAGLILLIGLLASAGLAVYYRHQANDYRKQMAPFVNQAHATQPPLNAEKPPLPASPASNPSGVARAELSDEQSMAGREARIRELEALLQNKDALIVSLQQAATNRPADNARSQRRRQSWLDELKQSDPQRYTAFTNQREQVRQAVQISIAEKAEYFRDRDPSVLSEQDQADYQNMAQLLDETGRLTEMLRSDISPDDRRAVMQTLHQDRHELEPLLDSARSREFVNLGRQLGYNDDDAQAFGEYISKVIDLTSLQTIYRAARMGPPSAPHSQPPPP